MGGQFREAFGFARQLGVKTCIGTEAPLTIPAGRAGADEGPGQEPGRSGRGARGLRRHVPPHHGQPSAGLLLALDAGRLDVGAATMRRSTRPRWPTSSWPRGDRRRSVPPFQLATCGWVLGSATRPRRLRQRPAQGHAHQRHQPGPGLHRGRSGASAGFPAARNGRFRGWKATVTRAWPACNCTPGGMRRDAADAAAYGCTGLMGLHWRTEILSPNVAALAQAAWDQSWKPSHRRAARTRRWQARVRSPRVCPATNSMPIGRGPTSAPRRPTRSPRCSPRSTARCRWPWPTAARRRAGPRRDALEPRSPPASPSWTTWKSCAATVRGAGNLDRFDYWLNTFKYYRSLAQVRCDLACQASRRKSRGFGATPTAICWQR